MVKQQKKINEVLVLQKRALRLMARASDRTHCKPLFTKFKILTAINQQ